MSSTTLTVLDPAMKVIASESLFNNILESSELADLFQTDERIQEEMSTGGRYIERAHIVGLPAGVGGRAEGDNLPEADDPSFLNSRIYIPAIYGTLEMSGHTMRRVVADEGSFLNWAQESFEYFSKRVSFEWDRMLCAYGYGIKAQINGTMSLVSSGVYDVTLQNSFGVSGLSEAWLLFLEGERIVFSSTATGTALRNAGTLQSAKVTNIFEATNKIRVAADSTLAAAVVSGDYIFPGDSAGFSGVGSLSRNREAQGLLAAVDDGSILATYLNVTRANVRQFQGYQVDTQDATAGFAGAFNDKVITYGDQQVAKSMGAKIDALICSINANRAYWDSQRSGVLWQNQQTYATEGGRPNGLAVRLGDRLLQLRVCRKLSPELAFGITKSSFKLFTAKKWSWDDTTGAIWNRTVSTSGKKDSFYAVGTMEGELVCSAPRNNVRFNNIATVY